MICRDRTLRRNPMVLNVVLAFVLVLAFGWSTTLVRAASQDNATPAVANLADPADCTVAPLSAEAFTSVDNGTPYGLAWFEGTPVATPPPPIGVGIPADAATVAAVTDTANQVPACLNAGDLLRFGALLSEQGLRLSFAGVAASMLEGFQRAPGPLPVNQRVPVLTVRDVLVYPDGQVTAILEANGASQLSVFIKSGDRYVIDSTYPLTAALGTPVP